MLTEQVLNNTLEFLKRVDLKGAEVPAFVEVLNALSAEVNALAQANTKTE